ncbi:L,D-transpeptidase [Romboutsia maritimum]|uniref:L,D-transpeptidase n=1 Tax=Romboutsia maritimum TaxID=2020948 RepID=A0A371IS45_9FIRM|nr:L,D-transpeptidase [Romboutsia maritimum]RDY23283.1 L,D-transpeptidase [Romboutsia maritimum]
MFKKVKQFLTASMAVCLILGGASGLSYADSQHLLVVNSKKNTMGHYVNKKLVKEYRVSTGRLSSPTPQGKVKIVNKIVNRPYYSGGIAGGSPNNPLGNRWMGLNINGTHGTTYGIHGNINENSIGKNVTEGCIRMHNNEVRELYSKVPVGTEVIINFSDDTNAKIASKYGISIEKIPAGWKKINNEWYYLNDNESYQKNGWSRIRGEWYYFNSKGAIQTGWNKQNSNWYYLHKDGKMEIGWENINNNWYYFHNNGVMEVGWEQIGSNWYHFNNSGQVEIGWKMINGNWYYFNNQGIMSTGYQTIYQNKYYFADNGIMAHDVVLGDGSVVGSDGIIK